MRLGRVAHRLRYAVQARLQKEGSRRDALDAGLRRAIRLRLDRGAQVLDRSRLRMELLDPRLVLQRGYALLTDETGTPVTTVQQTHPGQLLVATLADGEVDLTVAPRR